MVSLHVDLTVSPSRPHRTKPKTGVVLFNLGGPATTSEVYPFLHRLFSDPDLIPLPFQRHLAPWIAKRRTPSIQEQYQKIGGGSPIRMWTERQGKLLTEALDRACPESGKSSCTMGSNLSNNWKAPHKAYIAFRYAAPLTEETVEEMKQDGVQRAIGFTQYPQYSCSTTGSSMNELHRVLARTDPERSISWSFIDRWPTHPGLIKVG